jgi:hypothetical protein
MKSSLMVIDLHRAAEVHYITKTSELNVIARKDDEGCSQSQTSC